MTPNNTGFFARPPTPNAFPQPIAQPQTGLFAANATSPNQFSLQQLQSLIMSILSQLQGLETGRPQPTPLSGTGEPPNTSPRTPTTVPTGTPPAGTPAEIADIPVLPRALNNERTNRLFNFWATNIQDPSTQTGGGETTVTEWGFRGTQEQLAQFSQWATQNNYQEPNTTPLATAVAQAQQEWAGIRDSSQGNYTFVYTPASESLDSGSDIEVTVQGGQLVSAEYLNGPFQGEQAPEGRRITIDDIYQAVSEGAATNPNGVRFERENTLAFVPDRVLVDVTPNIADDDLNLTINSVDSAFLRQFN